LQVTEVTNAQWDAVVANADYSGNVTDPSGPASGATRVTRGGGWNSLAGDARSAVRTVSLPGLRYFFLGFRLVLPSGQ